MKPTALMLGDSLTQCFNLGCFCGVGFSRSLSPNEIELGVLNDLVSRAIGDETLVKVSITTPITKASA